MKTLTIVLLSICSLVVFYGILINTIGAKSRRHFVEVAMKALRSESRFDAVFVRQPSEEFLIDTLTLYGETATEDDKWDARSVLWRVLGNPPKGPNGIFNEIRVIPRKEPTK